MERLPKIILPGDINQSRTWVREVERIQNLKKEKQTSEIFRDRVSVQVETQGLPYFFILPLSDTHIGGKGVDYEALNKYIQAVQRYPFYVVTLGDLGDFFAPRHLPHAMMTDVLTPTEQAVAVKAFLQSISDKLISVVPGNHDKEFGEKTSGFNLYEFLTSDLHVPLLNSGGILNLKVNQEEYNIKLAHKFARVNSMFNRTHAGKQAIRFNPKDNLDAVISGDKHVGSAETTTIGGKKVLIVQTGTFKTDDEWGKEMGFVEPPDIFFPLLAFDGRTHNFEVIENLDAAIEFMETVKRLWKKNKATSPKEADEIFNSSGLAL